MRAGFQLDPRLAADTVAIGRSDGALILLMDDARWPWIILVPERMEVSQLHELEAGEAARLLGTSLAVGRAMVGAFPDRRLNVAALGNVVPQLHLHHVLRHAGDPAWPGPVWGFGARVPHGEEGLEGELRRWRGVLADLI